MSILKFRNSEKLTFLFLYITTCSKIKSFCLDEVHQRTKHVSKEKRSCYLSYTFISHLYKVTEYPQDNCIQCVFIFNINSENTERIQMAL